MLLYFISAVVIILFLRMRIWRTLKILLPTMLIVEILMQKVSFQIPYVLCGMISYLVVLIPIRFIIRCMVVILLPIGCVAFNHINMSYHNTKQHNKIVQVLDGVIDSKSIDNKVIRQILYYIKHKKHSEELGDILKSNSVSQYQKFNFLVELLRYQNIQNSIMINKRTNYSMKLGVHVRNHELTYTVLIDQLLHYNQQDLAIKIMRHIINNKYMMSHEFKIKLQLEILKLTSN